MNACLLRERWPAEGGSLWRPVWSAQLKADRTAREVTRSRRSSPMVAINAVNEQEIQKDGSYAVYISLPSAMPQQYKATELGSSAYHMSMSTIINAIHSKLSSTSHG